jgi:hypothetical protein
VERRGEWKNARLPARQGRMEEWNNGIMECWKIGMLEDWNNGIIE